MITLIGEVVDAQTGSTKHKAASPAGDRLAVTVPKAQGIVKPFLLSLSCIKYVHTHTLYIYTCILLYTVYFVNIG